MGRKKKTEIKAQVNSTDNKKYYIAVKTVHLGGLKRTVQKGTSILYVKTGSGEEYIEIDGEKINNLNDFNICIRHKFFEETDKVTAEKSDKEIKEEQETLKEDKEEKKFPVYKSDEDLMQEDIDISYTKNSYMKKEKEENSTKKDIDEDKVVNEVRGMKVLKENNQSLNEGIDMKVSVSKSSDGMDDIAKEINGEMKEVAKISTTVKKEEKAAGKRKPNNEAVKRAVARKKESEKNQKKLAEEKKKK